MTTSIITPEQLLKHWQAHRGLTRRVIEAFPEKELFEFSVGNMRPFAQLTFEMLSIAGPGLECIVKQVIEPYSEEKLVLTTKAALLEKWDSETEIINHYYHQIPAENFSDVFNLFGQFEFTIMSHILYFIDNEVHHRGQGYVYLRALGIAPPFFWER